MKNKKNIYILLPAVLIVWGLVGYRIFSTITPKTTFHQQNTAYTFALKPLHQQERFSIRANYRDPFLGTINSPQKVKRKTKKAEPPIARNPFPEIDYKGLVSGSGDSSPVFIIAVNGQQFFFKKNTSFAEVKLVKGNNKEVVLRFKGRQQSFSISK